jgi:glycosyltransferase involved in cell wall biosynthesis
MRAVVPPEISVIVPARDAAATLGETLVALAGQDVGRPYEVIVVDDGSTDRTAEIARGASGKVRVVSQAAAGPGPARDRGVAEARGTVLAFTDADCIPEPGWLRAGTAALEDADLVQGAVRPDPRVERRPFDRTIWVDGEVALYETANLLARRDLYERIGGFEDWLGPVLGKPLAEDVWFGWRARRAGARIRFASGALVHHAVFRRGLVEYAAERARLVYFPAIVARIPELRRQLLFARLFLNRRTAAFDLGIAAGAAAAVTGWWPALLAALPYAWMVARGAWRWRGRAPLAAAGELAADAVGLGALMAGSARRRTLVL